jgi:hypothetical protein
MKEHHILLAIFAVSTVAGFYLANAQSGTGIYANALVGQTAANIYAATNNAATGANAVATS